MLALGALRKANQSAGRADLDEGESRIDRDPGGQGRFAAADGPGEKDTDQGRLVAVSHL